MTKPKVDTWYQELANEHRAASVKRAGGGSRARRVPEPEGEWIPPEEALASEVAEWQRVAAYFLGGLFVDTHSAAECIAEARERAERLMANDNDRPSPD